MGASICHDSDLIDNKKRLTGICLSDVFATRI